MKLITFPTFKKTADKKLELSVINPTYVQGPVLHGQAGTSMELVARIIGKQMPMLPKAYVEMCDVRDVARAHLKAMTLPADQVVGKRHLIFSRHASFHDVRKILF